jgi:ATP-dependent DNA helicase RecQ
MPDTDTASSGNSMQLRLSPQPKSTRKSPAKKSAAQLATPETLSPADQQLEQALKAWRATLAKKLGMPPFVVLHDRTLRAIAHARPTTPNQLQEISGMGPAKVDKYGSQILEIIAS